MKRRIITRTLATGVITAGLIAAGLAGPTTAAAQTGLDVRVTPRAGLLTPADWFYEEFSHFGTDPMEWTEAVILRAAVVGLAVEAEVPGAGIWVRGEALRTIDAITSMTHAVLFGTSGFDPPRVERTPYRVATTVTSATFDLAFPTRLALGPVQPYVTAGIGGKWYGFDTDPFLELQDRVVLPQPGVVAVLNVGAGATARLFGLTFDLQVRDALSEYWGRLQHDVMFLSGVTWNIF